MTMTETVNPHELARRRAKAWALRKVMAGMLARNPRLTVDEIAEAGPLVRSAAASLADVRYPSEATWELVVAMLRRSHPGR